MARAKKGATETALIPKVPLTDTTDLADWEKELLADAEKSVGKVDGIGGMKRISVRGGVMTLDKNIIPGSQIRAIVVATAAEKQFFLTPFDSSAENHAPPDCYAFAPSLKEITGPHANVENPCNEVCATCRNNAFGSANTGKGKACSDRIKMVLIPYGEGAKAENLAQAEFVGITIPATSLPAWAAYVKSLKTYAARPEFAAVTIIKAEPDPKNQVKVSFLPDIKLGQAEVMAVKARIADAENALNQPYPKASELPPAQKKGKAAPKTSGKFKQKK